MSETVKKTTEVVEAEPTMCKTKEKIGHAIGVLGHDSAYTLWATWMTPFLTDIVQIPALVLGILLAAARIFDGVNDIVMGVLADRTRSRWGRFRPWILRAGPLFCVCVALSFIIPSDNMVVRIVFACVMYFAVDIVFTAVDIPFWSLPAAMTSNTKERSTIIGTTTTASNAITGLVGVVMPIMLAMLGEFKWTSYFTIAAVVSAFGAVMYFISFKMVREHVVPDDTEKFSLKLALQNIFTNQPLLCVQLANIACLLGMVLKGGFNYFYFTYNVGSLALMSLMSLVGLFAGIVGSLLFTIASRFIGKKNCMYIIATLIAAAQLVLFFAGWSNVAIIFICSGVTSICTGALMVCVNAMMADTIEYGEWKTGQRNEALITSTRCFVTKLVMALSGIIVATTIGLTGYTPGVEQAASTLTSFHTMYSLGCGGIVVLGVVPMFFYKLTEKRHAEIMVDLTNRKEAKNNK